MIIDGHAHVYPERTADIVISAFVGIHHMEPTEALGKGTPSQLKSRMRENGIDYTVLANFDKAKRIRRTNEWTLNLAKENPEFIPLISICPGMTPDEVKEYFRNGAKGIKMHNGIQNFEPDDTALDEIYSFCNEHSIAITFHCGETSRVHMNEYAEMSHILPVVRRYKNIPFVLTHLAAGDPDLVVRIAEECRNVLFDTSITLTGEHCIHRIHDCFWEDDGNTASLIRKVGADRFAFGTDYPFGSQASDIRRIRNLDLSDEEKEMILGKNTYRLYFKNGKPDILNGIF